MSRRSFTQAGLSALLAALVGLGGATAGPEAAWAAEIYQRKTVAVFGDADDLAPATIRKAFQELGRFDYEAIPVRGCDDLYDFLERYRERVADTAADKAARELAPDEKFKEIIVDGTDLDRIMRSAYALVPQGRYSPWIQLDPQVSIVDRDGKFSRKTTVTFRSHYAFRLMVYDLAARRSIAHYAATFPLETSLTREVRISAEEARKPLRAHLDRAFLDEIAILLFAHPRERLHRQAISRLQGEMPGLMKWARGLDPFILKSAILSTDAERDEIHMALGKDVGIRTDNSYRVVRRIKREDGDFDLRDVGMVKVRRMEATSSIAQSLIVDAPFAPGDQLIERPRLDWNASLKAGIAPFRIPASRVALAEGPSFVQGETSVAPTLTWSNELGLGAMTGISELYGLLDATLLAGSPIFAVQGEVGLLKKHFRRRWGWHYGAKVGVVHAMADGGPVLAHGLRYPTSTLSADAPGVTGLAGMNYQAGPDVLFSLDLGLQAYAPTMGWSLHGRADHRELDLSLGDRGGLPSIWASGLTVRGGIAVTF